MQPVGAVDASDSQNEVESRVAAAVDDLAKIIDDTVCRPSPCVTRSKSIFCSLINRIQHFQIPSKEGASGLGTLHDDLKDKLVTSNLYSNACLEQAQEVVREVQLVVDTLVLGKRTATLREKRMAVETVNKAKDHFSSLLTTVRAIKRGLVFTTWLSTRLREMAPATARETSSVF